MAITKIDELAADREEPVSMKIAVTKFSTIKLPVNIERTNNIDPVVIAFFASRVTGKYEQNSYSLHFYGLL